MTAIRFVVPGDPVPWERVQSRRGQRFTAPRTRIYQRKIRYSAKQHFRTPLSVPMSLVVVAYRATARRADWDNLGKTVSDALNGIAWRDDSQVVLATVHKLIDRENPRIEVEVRPCPETGWPVDWTEAVEQSQSSTRRRTS